MNHDPTAWKTLGKALRSDRERQGLTRQDLAQRVIDRGGKITTRSIGSLEAGVVPRRGTKPPSLEPAAAALDWRPGWVDRILAGEDPHQVLGSHDPGPGAAPGPREMALELLPTVYEFSRVAVSGGGDAFLRDEFDEMAQRLLQSIPAGAGIASGSAYGLAAYRPHAVGEGVPADDAERIAGVMDRSQ